MPCRVFLFESSALCFDGFKEKLDDVNWQMQFASGLDEFKNRFVGAQTDVLILRGQDDTATIEYLQSVLTPGSGCGIIWLYPRNIDFKSPYCQMADNWISKDVTVVELTAIVESLFNLLTRSGVR